MPQTLHPRSPITNGLYWRSAFPTKAPTLVRDYSLNSILYLDLISCSLTDIFCSRLPVRIHSAHLLRLWSVPGSDFPWLWWECWWALVFCGARSALPCSSASFCFSALPFLPPSGLPASAFLRKVSACKILPLALSSRKSVVRLSYSRLLPVLGTPPENLSGSSHPLLIGRSPTLALALANNWGEAIESSTQLLSCHFLMAFQPESLSWLISQEEKHYHISGSDS